MAGFEIMPDGSVRVTTPDGRALDAPPGMFDVEAMRVGAPPEPVGVVDVPVTPAVVPPVSGALPGLAASALTPPAGMFQEPEPVPVAPADAPPGMFAPPVPARPVTMAAAPPGMFPEEGVQQPPRPAATFDDRFGGAIDDEAAAIRRAGEIKTGAAQRYAQGAQGEIEAQRGRLADNDRMRAEADAKADAMSDEIRRDADALRDIRVDPMRVWHNMGTAGKIMSAVGLFAGGFGTWRTGGKNMAAEQIDRAIEQDLQAQMAELGNKREALGAKQSLYAQNLQRYRDADAARTATAMAMYDLGAKALEAERDQLESPLNIEKANAEIAALQQKKEAALQQFRDQKAEREFDQVMKRRSLALQAAGQELERTRLVADAVRDARDYNEGVRRFDAQMNAEMQKAAAAGDLKRAEMLKDRKKLLVTLDPTKAATGDAGGVVEAPDPETARELRTKLAVTADLAQTLDQMDTLRTKYNPKEHRDFENTSEFQQLQALHKKAVIAMKEAAKLGVLAGPDMGIIEGQIGESPTTWKEQGDRWRQTRTNIIDTANYELKYKATYNGPRWEPSVDSRITGMTAPGSARPPADSTAAKNARAITAMRSTITELNGAPTELSDQQLLYLAETMGDGPGRMALEAIGLSPDFLGGLAPAYRRHLAGTK